MKALYRKMNDGSMNSSTYHKKDGTPVRARMKAELLEQTTKVGEVGSIDQDKEVLDARS